MLVTLDIKQPNRLILDPIRLTYSRPLIARAIRAYWIQQVGFLLPAATLGMLGFAIYLYTSGDRSWLLGAASVMVVLAVGTMIAVYVVQLRRSLAKIDAMGEPHAILTIGDDFLRIESGAGASEIPWNSISRARQYDEFWLLYLNSAVFFTIPLVDLPESEVETLLRKIQASVSSGS